MNVVKPSIFNCFCGLDKDNNEPNIKSLRLEHNTRKDTRKTTAEKKR